MSDESFTCDITDTEWDNFVYPHPLGNIFQTRALYNVYAETKNYFPVHVAVTDPKSQEIQGIMAGVVIREIDGLLGGFSTHSVVQGGPLTVSNSDMVSADLLHRYDSLVSKSCLYTEIRNMHDVQSILEYSGNYVFVDHLNFIINLNQSLDGIWGQIHNSRRRRIKKAEKTGVFVEEIVDSDKIPIFYDLLGETYNNVKVPLVDISLFESAFRELVPRGVAKFFLARYEDNYIGARAVLLYRDRIYDWYAGAAVDYLSLNANACLVWHILKWGRENNYSIFDFGGAGEPNKPYGPREFKRSFGGELVNYGRNVCTYSNGKTRVAELGFKVYRKIFL
ncbi:lipid II:glycine glycyltransferase FemX [Methanoculleus sp.]|uniref:lipid II:glycine glycyltransferase FemX n=1 Tax=Methanoculleus sp. TaxID=90427 RepID=UPI001BD4A920|nr:GNAT family N-acetyltransferase [Methanoculleus sp.]